MSDFWLIQNKEQLNERMRFLFEHLRDSWDWSQPVELKVKPYVKSRSLSQNALFHVWCREMADHFKSRGADVNEDKMKDLLKYKFLGTEDRVVGKTVIPSQLRETSGLDKGEMMDFMDQVQNWGLDLGVELTCPADSEYMRLKHGN
jgi:hypothetical protein